VKPSRVLLAVGSAVAAAAWWWRKNPSACPYGQRFWVEAPHPFITRARLAEALEPRPGDHLLEVGPGTGYYTIDIARSIAPRGELEIFDLQQKMLDHTMRRVVAAGLSNVTAKQGDARALPYDDATFDGAFLTAVLGEISDQGQAVSELHRVLKPGGRLVVGELLGDPHYVRLATLRARAAAAGFSFDGKIGPLLGYFARFKR
jgi:ubiquinone/menaquinone biosynthesis C-methylase UbiE